MKPKVYKAKETKENIVGILEEREYFKLGQERSFLDEKVSFTLFMNKHDKNLPMWLTEILSFFSIEENFEQNKQINAVILVETAESIYFVPMGQAYSVIEKVSDIDFGLNFGEKVMRTNDVLLKGVSFIQRNKMRGVTNYRKGQSEFPQASESYISVQGKPADENIFGKNISCGIAIDFSKNFSINDNIQIHKFVNLFNEIDAAMKLPSNKSTFPRVSRIKKKDPLSKTLDKALLNKIKNKENNLQIYFDLNKIQLIGNSIEIIDNQGIKAYISRNQKATLKEINADSEDISNFIREHKDIIKTIDDIKINVIDENNLSIKSGENLKSFIHSEIRYENQDYILENGYWCYFNKRFSELLQKQLEEINDKVVEVNCGYSKDYLYENSGELSGEGGYIEELCKNEDKIKLHKRFINFSGTNVEIADIYDGVQDELLAIKRGTNTSTSLYSFEQSILSMQALANQGEFKVYEELEKYNNRNKYNDEKKYPYLTNDQLKKITQCRNASVLWLIDDSVKYIYDQLINGNVDLNKFKSLLLKLKILDWYSFTREHLYTPKLYFALDRGEKRE